MFARKARGLLSLFRFGVGFGALEVEPGRRRVGIGHLAKHGGRGGRRSGRRRCGLWRRRFERRRFGRR